MPYFDKTGPSVFSYGPRDGRGSGYGRGGQGIGPRTGGQRGLRGIGAVTPGDDKTQWIRLADVFAIGPLMVYGGYRLSSREKVLGWLLAALGVGTVAYNGKNYLEKR